MDYILRKAVEQDLPSIIELNGLLADHHHVLDPYWKTGLEAKTSFGETLKDELENPNTMWLVAQMDEKIIGYFSAEIISTKPYISVPKIGHLSSGFVLEEYRGKGIAKEAVEKFFEWFKQEGVTVAELTVDSRNTDSVKAWESLGFREYMKRMKLNL